MARKTWTPLEIVNEDQIKLREKKKWQIALRRYVIEGNPSLNYAPYFGLDSRRLRIWFEKQFKDDQDWNSFGKTWQFEHLIPTGLFDFSNETDLRLCWNFLNLRVGALTGNKELRYWLDAAIAIDYFSSLTEHTTLKICHQYLQKLKTLTSGYELGHSQAQFLQDEAAFLETVSSYSVEEFQLLNLGRTTEEITREMEMLKKFTP